MSAYSFDLETWTLQGLREPAQPANDPTDAAYWASRQLVLNAALLHFVGLLTLGSYTTEIGVASASGAEG